MSEASSPKTTFFFPLRTNTGFFDSSKGFASLLQMVKQTSLLYDEIIFEGGIYKATFYEKGGTEQWTPYETRILERLKKERENFEPTGGTSAFYIGIEGRPAMPFVSGNVVRRFRSEFHTLLAELNAEHHPWIQVETFELTSQGKTRAEMITDEFAEEINSTLSEVTDTIRKTIAKNLGRDLLMSGELHAPISINSIYAPTLYNRAKLEEATGFKALSFAVPNFSDIGWDEIIDLRKERAFVEFRKMMHDIETKARDFTQGELTEREHNYNQLGQLFVQELLWEITELRPKLGEPIGNVALDLFFGLIPVPYIGTTYNAIKESIKYQDSRNSWLTVFLKLRGL